MRLPARALIRASAGAAPATSISIVLLFEPISVRRLPLRILHRAGRGTNEQQGGHAVNQITLWIVPPKSLLAVG